MSEPVKVGRPGDRCGADEMEGEAARIIAELRAQVARLEQQVALLNQQVLSVGVERDIYRLQAGQVPAEELSRVFH